MTADLSRFLASLDEPYRDLLVIGLELLLLGLAGVVSLTLLALLCRWLLQLPALQKHQQNLKGIGRRLKILLLILLVGAALGICGFNGYLIYQEQDLLQYTQNRLARIPPGFWTQLGLGGLKVLGLAILAGLVDRLLTRFLEKVKARALSYEQLKTNDASIEAFFRSLNHILTSTIWLVVLILSASLLPLPPEVAASLWIVLRIFLIVAIGGLVVRSMAAIVDSLEGLSKKYWYRDDYLTWYEKLRTLIPLFRRCLEYVIYLIVASLVLLQVDFIARFAVYGPRLIKVIGIFFLTRVVVEIVNLLVDRGMAGPAEEDEAESKRRKTLVPIIKSLLQSIVYFIAFVLMLAVFEFNPLPVLAGAGIVGVVFGLGAQPLINDIVSGFFILFENLFLVGDYVETGNARGVVESIQIRTTRIRDPDGQVHILRNGQLGAVVNFSRGYTNAVVEVGVAYDSDLDHVYRVLTETGQKLQQDNPLVLQPTEVKGLKAFGESELLVRTVTRVKPGHHREIAFVLRKMIKTAFDAEGIEIPFARRVLIFRTDQERDRFEASGLARPPGGDETG